MSIERNYITIQGWMITGLNLSGNNLLTFALIFGFCQDEETEFKGSINYICKWLNCSRPTAIKALNSLVESNLIKKRKEVVSGVTFNRYSINSQVVKKLYLGSKETLLVGGKEALPNNNSLNIYNDIIELKEEIEKQESDIVVIDGKEFLKFKGLLFPKSHIEHSSTYISNEVSLQTFMQQNKIKSDDVGSVKALLMEFNKHLNIDGKYYEESKFKGYRQHFINWHRRMSSEERSALKSPKKDKLPDGVQPAEWLS